MELLKIRQEKSLLRNKVLIDSYKLCCSHSFSDDLMIESTILGNRAAFSPYQSPKHLVTLPQKKNRLNLPSVALPCDYTGVSDRAAAIIASSVFIWLGIISSKDPSGIIDR